MRVRRAEPRDLPAVARLAGALVRMHHALDPARYMLPEQVEEGYRWFLSRELKRKAAVVLVAEREDPSAGDTVIGYAYASLEGRDWSDLLDEHGKVHDVFVDPSARRGGVARALMTETVAALRALGARQIILMTASENDSAQRLFRTLGFRPTMLEMTLGRDDG